MKTFKIGPLSISFEWGDSEWKKIARTGPSQYIEAIKVCRASQTPLLRLREAKDMVDAYLLKKGIRTEEGRWQ